MVVLGAVSKKYINQWMPPKFPKVVIVRKGFWRNNEETEDVRVTECIDTAEVVIFRVCCDIKYRDGEHT